MINYKDAGVDVNRGYKTIELIKEHVKATYNKNVLTDLGGFSGLYDIGNDQVLVSGTDGVGTKLKYAFILDKHDSIGIDCVAMSVNDVICTGARPLFFLDYYATGFLNPSIASEVVKGVALGCKQANCALIGGETAEMPSMYSEGEYDLAGFCVGIANKNEIINGKNIIEGDSLIGVLSSGIHSNGFSLVRKLFGEDKEKLLEYNEVLKKSLAEEVLTPTKIYAKTVLSLKNEVEIKGISHITGGGFIENIPRMFPKNIGCQIDLSSYPILPVFDLIRHLSGLDNLSLYNTFNMGVGLVICVNKKDAEKTVKLLEGLGERAYIIGTTIKGEGVSLK